MHVLGKSSRVDLVRSDGTEECLLNVPEWDFNWQGSYRFRGERRRRVAPLPAAAVHNQCIRSGLRRRVRKTERYRGRIKKGEPAKPH